MQFCAGLHFCCVLIGFQSTLAGIFVRVDGSPVFFFRILLAHNESSYRTFVSCNAQAVAPTADRRSQWAQLLTATFPHNNVRLSFTILGTSTDFFCHEEGPDCYSKTTTEDSSSETCVKYKNVFRQDVQRHSTRIAALQKCVVCASKVQ